jgi:hypothetical protein
VSTILRWVGAYYTSTALARWMTLIGVTLLPIGLFGTFYYSRYAFLNAKFKILSFTGDLIVWGAPTLGLIALFLAAAPMPAILSRLLPSKQLYLLPHGRMKLIISALTVPALMASVFATVMAILYAAMLDPQQVFDKAWVVSFLSFCLLYAEVWLISKARSAVTLLAGAMMALLSLGLPLQFIRLPGSRLRIPVIGAFVILTIAVAAGFYGRHWRQRWPGRLPAASFRYAEVSTPNSNHQAFALLLGTSNPWWLALAQGLPFLLATQFIDSPKFWLFYLMLFSLMSGAISSYAAARARHLWLRAPWSRAELFNRVESAFWRQNLYSAGALICLLCFIGIQQHFSGDLFGAGCTLIILGTASSTYLGLLMTRKLSALDGMLAAVIVVSLMSLALGAADSGIAPPALLLGILVLGALTILLRLMARARWRQLDWMLCR